MDQLQVSERIAFSRPPDVPGVEILAADHTRRLFRVYHETYTLCIGTGGEWFYRQRPRFTGPGEVMLIEPGELHVSTALVGGIVSFHVAFIDPKEIQRVATDIGGSPSYPHLALANVEGDPFLFDRLGKFFESLEHPSTILERQSHLTAAVGRILQRYTEGGLRTVPSAREPAAVKRVREYLHAHYTDAVSLEDCALAAGLSRFHTLRAFAKETSLPPHAYQTQLRIARARRMLTAGMAPAVVASEVGFADQSHFTRSFRRALGVTPGAYARAVRSA